jgi:hypothetical protein
MNAISNPCPSSGKFIYIFVLVLVMISLGSCKKEKIISEENISKTEVATSVISNAINPPASAYCVSDQESLYIADSILKPTILGAKLNGYPYSVSAMQQAAQQILGTSAGVSVNAWYIRFKPSNYDQLAALEDNDIDLFDYPLDYELIEEGDYFDDGTNTSTEDIPWLYAVVPVNFITPAGITNQLLQQIHVPADQMVEKKAFENTGNYVDDLGCFTSASSLGNDTDPNTVNPCPDPCYSQCPDYDPTACGGGGGGGSTFNTRIPNGTITVTDDILNTNVPVRNARVVAKRFLKIERTFTNNFGQYQFTKKFRNKVKLNIKFKNNDAIVKGLRGIRLWQILNACKNKYGYLQG